MLANRDALLMLPPARPTSRVRYTRSNSATSSAPISSVVLGSQHPLSGIAMVLGCSAAFALGLRQRFVVLDRLDQFFNIATEHNVGTTTGHIGRDSNHPRSTGLFDDFSFLGVLLGVQYLMRNLPDIEHSA